MSEILSKTQPKARKHHWCEWCGLSIAKGVIHNKTAYLSDGDFNSVRMHIKCEEEYFQAIEEQDIDDCPEVSISDIRCEWEQEHIDKDILSMMHKIREDQE